MVGCGQDTKACCWGTKSRKCACLSVVSVLLIVLSLGIGVLSYIANYRIPDFKVRLQSVSITNLCSTNWEVNTTAEIYCSETRASISDITAVLSYQGADAVSLIVPGSIAQFGWNVYQWTLPTTVYQKNLASKFSSGSLEAFSWSDFQVDIYATVYLPVIGILLSKSFHITLDLGEVMTRPSPSPPPSPPSPPSNSSLNDTHIRPFFLVNPGELIFGSKIFTASQRIQFGVDLPGVSNRSLSAHGLPDFPMPDLASSYWNSHLENGAIIRLPPEIVLDFVQSEHMNVEASYLARVAGGITLQAYWQPIKSCASRECEVQLRVVGAVNNVSLQMDELNEDLWANITTAECGDMFGNITCSFPQMNFTHLMSQIALRVTGRPPEQCALASFVLNRTDGITIEQIIANATRGFRARRTEIVLCCAVCASMCLCVCVFVCLCLCFSVKFPLRVQFLKPYPYLG